MKGKHHRGVDRTVAILESVARRRDGLTLTELARALDAPVSSVQQLVYGLVAVGFLNEDDRRFTLGPGAFALTMQTDWRSIAPISHELVEDLSAELGCTMALGLLVGDNLMYFDEAGSDPAIEYYATSRSRRPVLASAGGKRLLAGLPDFELQHRLRSLSERHPAGEVDQFLAELPEIRATGLAYGRALEDILAVAAGIPGRRGKPAAALIAVGSPASMVGRIDDVGAILLERIRRHCVAPDPRDERFTDTVAQPETGSVPWESLPHHG
ncbi:helix-turn-helix domain-containing protein [Nocardia speluncae]|uniref:Helix-turn-helix domain-containing protein n=1 Tax=Nocardia speluncae TaxID=419477 RepID=A0A846XFE9_9NOCA|nr:helix-turn-helix domain-containing protein [Nocardia speluncae]NKY34672.1 helix-turn-helix domain-containing protein [Nocardia speluncae]